MWQQWLVVTFARRRRRRRLSHLGRCCGRRRRRRPNLRCTAATAAAAFVAAANEMRNHVDRHGKDDGCIFFITNCTEGLEKRDMYVDCKEKVKAGKLNSQKTKDQNFLLESRYLVISDPLVQWRNNGILGARLGLT